MEKKERKSGQPRTDEEDLAQDAESKNLSEATAAYKGENHPDQFHVIVEQAGNKRVVPSSGAVPFPPAIEKVHVIFADAIEWQRYLVTLGDELVPAPGTSGDTTKRVYRLRQQGDSGWGEPWAVEVAFEETSDGWLTPMELRYEGIAKHRPFGEHLKRGLENDDDELLEGLV